MDAAHLLSRKGSFQVRRILGMYLQPSAYSSVCHHFSFLSHLLRAYAHRLDEVWEEESSLAIPECLSVIIVPDRATLFP